MQSPCIENNCEFKDTDKNRPECIDCQARKDYVLALGGPSTSVPVEITNFGGRMRTWKKWTAEDKQFLKQNYQTMTNKQIGEQLGRQAHNVAAKLGNMNLKRNRFPKEDVTLPPSPGLDLTKKIQKPNSRKDYFILDFSPYSNLYHGLQALAEKNFRTPENQILCLGWRDQGSGIRFIFRPWCHIL